MDSPAPVALQTSDNGLLSLRIRASASANKSNLRTLRRLLWTPLVREDRAVEVPFEEHVADKHFSAPSKDLSTPRSFDICILAWTGKSILITNMNNSNTVGDLKTRIYEQEGIPLRWQRIFFAGKMLEDSKSANMVNHARVLLGRR